jgi:hypothetical protein
MLEGWEWILIIGGVAFIMVVVLVVALLFAFARPKTVVLQNSSTPQYPSQNSSQSSLNKFCTRCGSTLAENDKFCSKCGKHMN